MRSSKRRFSTNLLGHPVGQPAWPDLRHGVPHERPLRRRLQPGRSRGGRHQHRRPPALRRRDVPEDENPAGASTHGAQAVAPGVQVRNDENVLKIYHLSGVIYVELLQCLKC